jgi:ribonuclease P protein component
MSTPPLPVSFPRRAHLRTSAEFQAVFAEGKRISGRFFRAHAHLPADAIEARLGIAVSKRVDKSAVVRNRLRRQVKETFRLHRIGIAAGNYVFVAKPEAAKADNRELREDLLVILDRARTLKPVPAPGTMPPCVAGTDRKPTEP